jgi:hypothetical protein
MFVSLGPSDIFVSIECVLDIIACHKLKNVPTFNLISSGIFSLFRCKMLRVFRVLCVVGALSVFFATARAFQVPTSPCANPSRVAGGRAPLSVRARVPAALKPRTVLKAGFFDNLLGGGSSGSSGSDKVDDKVPEWAELIDEASGKPYYWNQLTGETSWVPPSSVLTMPLPDPENDNLLSDEDYYAKITARVDAEGGPKKDFGELVEFPVMYDGW